MTPFTVKTRTKRAQIDLFVHQQALDTAPSARCYSAEIERAMIARKCSGGAPAAGRPNWVGGATDFPQQLCGIFATISLFFVTAKMRGGFCCFLSHGNNMQGAA
jgi:hypothetical protein